MGWGPVPSSGSGSAYPQSSAIPTSGAYTVGQIIFNSTPAPGSEVGWVCTTAGNAYQSQWMQSTNYSSGNTVLSNGNVYTVATAGRSGTTPPAGTSNGQTDGTVVWNYVGAASVFQSFGAISSSM